MLINIPEDVARRLEQLAQERATSVGDVLETLLDLYAPDTKPATLADLARIASEAGLSTPHPVDTASRSREILNTEYADYLKKRRDPSPDDDLNR